MAEIKQRVFVVDDEPVIAMTLTAILRAEGLSDVAAWEILSAAEGAL